MEPTSRSSPPQQGSLAFGQAEGHGSFQGVQGEVSSDPKTSPAAPVDDTPLPVADYRATTDPHRSPLWLHRFWLVIFVVFCVELGLLLIVLPWTQFWTNNSLLAGLPAIRRLLGHNFVRGLASGLGLVDIWIGIAEAVHYREHP